MKKRIWKIWLTLVVSLVTLAPASAEIVTVEVEGVVNRIRTNGDFDLDGSININSIMNGFCVYDTEAPPQDFGHYFTYPIISTSITLGNYTFTQNPASPESAFIRVGYDDGYIYDFQSLDTLVDGEIIIDGVPQPFNNNIGRSFLQPLMKLGISSEEPNPGPPYNLPNPFPDFSVFDMYKGFGVFIYPLESVSNYFWIHGELTSLTVVPEPATTYYVDALNGDDDNDGLSPETAFATIQKSIDSANNSDTVIVAPGTYTGPGNRDIDFLGKVITVRSIDPNDPNIVANTVVDCEYSGRGFIFQSGEDANSVLTGLTVIHGMPIVPPPPPGPSPPPTHGGGICCRESSPTISNCIIKRNTGGGGGGILCNYSSPKITNCTIYRNFARYTGGGIRCWHSSPTINNCVINNNTAINYGYMGTIGGDGGGISCAENSNPIVTNSIISGNSAGSCCGGVSVFNSPPITIINSIIRDNSTMKDNSDSEIAGSATVTYSNVKGGWTGVGNIDAEPLLTWDYHLQAGSPCINAGDPNYNPSPVQTDMDSEPRIISGRVDIGPDEFLDTDSDGLADWWEQKYFGDSNIANPADDPDGDEWTNLAEYTHSTEPNVVPTNYYVDPQGGDDLYDGLAPHWNGQHGPKEHIQPAVNACADRKNDIVTLAPGTYTGYSNKDIYFYGKAITVRSTDPCDPCVVAETIIDCERDESVGFVLVFNESPASVIKGLTITNGYAFIGMYSVNLVTKGGAIHCYRASPTIILSRIIANEADDQGGGIYCYKGSPIITGCTFTGNSADEGGGGIYSDGSSLTITNCTFTGNSADEGGGGIYSNGSSLTITNCTVTGNSVNGQVVIGGGIFSDGSSLTITNCTITGNSVNGDWAAGSAIYSFVSSLTITNCNISGNIAELIGSIFCSQSDLNISNCTITDNTDPAQLYDGGIWCIDSSPTITNCILWNNGGEDGYEIGAISWKEAVTVRVLYSDVDGAEDSIDIGPDCTLIWADNIDADPCFVEPGYWADWVWVDGDYHLLPGSPCIDAGDNNSVPADIHDLDGDSNTAEPIPFDLDGNPRIVDGDNDGNSVVDMGAYEAMVSCFGVNHVKLETKAGKKGNKVELKGTFSPALPIDFAVDDVAYIIDDGQGNMLAFLIPAGSFEAEGKPDKQKFKFHSAKGSQPDIKAKFDFDKCKFELNAKKVPNTDEITGTTLTIELWAGANLAQEVVQVQVKPKHTEYKREPKLSCCPKCKGIALMEVTSDQDKGKGKK